MGFSQIRLPYVSDRGGETGNSRPALLVLEGLLEGLILLMLQDAGCPGSAAQTPQSTTVLPGVGFHFIFTDGAWECLRYQADPV